VWAQQAAASRLDPPQHPPTVSSEPGLWDRWPLQFTLVQNPRLQWLHSDCRPIGSTLARNSLHLCPDPLLQERSPRSRQDVPCCFHSLLTCPLPVQDGTFQTCPGFLSAVQVCCPKSFARRTEVHVWPLLLVLDLTVSRLPDLASWTGHTPALTPHTHNPV
jgi:hypothetical protein